MQQIDNSIKNPETLRFCFRQNIVLLQVVAAILKKLLNVVSKHCG